MKALSLKARAIQLLARRDYSRFELKRKLLPYAETEEVLEELLKQLQSEQWLSDERFAESLVNRDAGRFGNARILHKLEQHQINPELIDSYQLSLADTELARVREVWEKKFDELPLTSKDYARQVRFLMARGFSIETIQKVVGKMRF